MVLDPKCKQVFFESSPFLLRITWLTVVCILNSDRPYTVQWAFTDEHLLMLARKS